MTKQEIDYTALRIELDEILASLDDDSLDVDEMTKRYERGMQVVTLLEKYLKDAENKVQRIKAQWDK